jgi:predicted transcriptional regulator of viral defense system
MWARAGRGPESVALSHATALAIYEISDANPARIHLTVPRRARLRRKRPEWVAIHRADLALDDVTVHEGLPLTTIARTVEDMLASTGQVSLVRQAISGARREGCIDRAEAQRLTRRVARHIRSAEADARKA